MNILSDLQKRILKEEYPNISLDSDPDVERYFELRSAGRQSDALRLYNTKIAQKYPDPEKRALLMRLYRSHDSAYHEILAESLIVLAERLLQRTKKIIFILTRDIETLHLDDAYSVIKLAEGLLSIISPDRYESIAFTEKYVRYAKILDYRHIPMEKTAELIRLYVTDNLVVLHEFRQKNEKRKKDKKKADDGRRADRPTIDLSKIQFDPADISRICIPSHIQKTEDIVIAYCIKYWNLVFNPTFEKTIFLYSRKYKTNHHEVFQAIKNGREHNWKDEEILNAVLSNVVTGYYYNISGDLYLQRMWSVYKGSIAAPPTEKQSQDNNNTKAKRITRHNKTQRNPANRRTSGLMHIQKHENSNNVIAQTTDETHRSIQKPIPAFKKATNSRTVELPKQPDRTITSPNSIADIIRKKTGKTYTVYKELFFRGILPSIRSILASSAVKKGSLFSGRQNDAEEIIYNFLFEHYSDPYQNWTESPARRQVEDLGYKIPEIEPVIEVWIKENR